ncbi:Sec-independent protein translocase protein TatB [Psychrobacter sp. 72-O-c]|uniref:Sec-independent protein translocase protein TatB n=1 Tax=Psychrobacter sp. 72-O-c TaxID=2774125 RepID=UPI00191957D5|nr:Sec-independent protein translocase protein TatB [Psychrobacter sp. 72-O-c]
MFDIGFSELFLFGVIALIVLGPEKLPQAARTAGKWYAKIRRTVSTLQSEIEAELDLAETRQQMQNELAKIRQTEADMKREIAEMRGNMQEFESSQNQSLKATQKTAASDEQAEKKQDTPAEFDYSYGQDHTDHRDQNHNEKAATEPSEVDSINSSENSAAKKPAPTVQPIITKPWENMWFRLSAYDKARCLPAPPRLPNYHADILLHTGLDQKTQADLSDTVYSEALANQPDKLTSLNKQQVD